MPWRRPDGTRSSASSQIVTVPLKRTVGASAQEQSTSMHRPGYSDGASAANTRIGNRVVLHGFRRVL